MKVLVINWQDRTHPLAGGAEVHLHEIFSRVAALGHEVHLLCCSHAGAPLEEEMDSLLVHRAGRRATFNLSVRRALQRLAARIPFDVVVEDVNKIPFYTPLYSPLPVLLLVPHLFGTTVFQEVSLPFALYVYLWERPLARVYRGCPVEAISQSTREDLLARGFRPEEVRVVYPGLDRVRYSPAGPRADRGGPYFLYLGRLKRYKRIDLILEALARISGRYPSARVVVAGSGDHRGALERQARRLGMAGRISFEGMVGEEEKVALLRGAYAVVNMSLKEGWGLTNIEAQASGAPVLASDSPGLRESLVDGRTGFLLPRGEAGPLAEKMALLLEDRGLHDRLAGEAPTWARQFSWERAARETEGLLEETRGRGVAGRGEPGDKSRRRAAGAAHGEAEGEGK